LLVAIHCIEGDDAATFGSLSPTGAFIFHEGRDEKSIGFAFAAAAIVAAAFLPRDRRVELTVQPEK